MRVTLSLERSLSDDVALMVDVLRASTTITVALDNFRRIIPVGDLKEARIQAEKYNAPLAGERNGKPITGFNAGNSPVEIKDLKGDVLILTTTNGTRILKEIRTKTLIGSFLNADSVAKRALEVADHHIEIVMAGVRGKFVIEDFLGAGEIISYLMDLDLDEMALAAFMATRDEKLVNQVVRNSSSASTLRMLGFSNDVEFCLQRNLYDVVPVYENGIIEKL
jgi:2-phosphosulfolactate phosphatase